MVNSITNNPGDSERVTVTRTMDGWVIREERDSMVVRTMTYTDWHRVERAIDMFELTRRAPEGGGR